MSQSQHTGGVTHIVMFQYKSDVTADAVKQVYPSPYHAYSG
jgi:hypothetical protein